MTLHFVTSAQDGPHIKSSDDARAYAGLFGNGAYVFKTGEKMSASMVDSNTLRILEGDSLFCGRKWNIRNFEDITIENGTPGLKRIDLVVAHFETSPKEELTLVVYKGVEVEEGDPVVPTHITGDLNMGDTVAEMPLYTVSLNGLTVGTPSQQFIVVDDLYGDWLLNATKALFGVTDEKKIPGSALVPHSVGKDQLATTVWDSIFRLAIGNTQNRFSATMKQDDDNGITFVYDEANNRLLASAALNGKGTAQKVLLNF